MKKPAIPMLRKDLDILRDEHKADLNSVHDEINRTFDLMKWLLGVIGLGGIATGVFNWLGKPGKTE